MVENFGFDFIYTSAKIEGNSYSIVETMTLLETRMTKSNKKIDDAIMILNLKEAYDYIIEHSLNIDKKSIREIHQILSQRLLRKEYQGGVRNVSVEIQGSNHIPLSSPFELEEQMDRMLRIYQSILNPFNRCVYIHNNLAYLQYFLDCNKRTTRTIQNVSLKSDNKMLFTIKSTDIDSLEEYKDSLLNYYDRGEYKIYKQFFIENYEKIRLRLLPFTQEFHKNKSIHVIENKSK